MILKTDYFIRFLNLRKLKILAYYLLVLSLPLIFKSFGLIYLPTGNRLPLSLLMVPFFSVISFLSMLKTKVHIQSFLIPYILPLILILCGYLWGTISTGTEFREVELFIKLFLLIALTFNIVFLAPSTKAIKISVFYLVLAVSFMAAIELLDVFEGQIKLVNIMRGFRGQNATAFTLLILIPFPLLSVTSVTYSRISQLLLIILAVLLMTCLFYTYSRGGILSLILGIITSILLTYKNKKCQKFLLLALIITIIVNGMLILTAPASLNKELKSSFDRDANLNRLILLKVGLGIVHDYPLAGLGPGRFDDVFPSYITQKDASNLGRPVYFSSHNQFIHFWNEGGILAFTGFVWLLVSIFRGLIGGLLNNFNTLILSGIPSCSGALWFFGVETPANLVIFWAILGFILAILKFSESE